MGTVTDDLVLNADLYAALAHCLGGRPRVVNRGQPLEGYYELDEKDPTRKHLKIVSRGETYTGLDCPYCNDRRGRLAVNHRWGVYDDVSRTKGYNLWKCYNEECQKDPVHREQFKLMLTARPADFRVRRPEVRVVDAGVLPPCEFPGLFVPLAELPPAHPAVAYLAGRDFDPAELSAVWGVGYAEHVPARTRGAMAQDRIVVPVRRGGVMVGYQARYVGEADWKTLGLPKYLTYFPKSRVLYGLDEAARDYSPVVVVEGVTDVWRYGPGAVSPLGKTLSPEQARLLAAALGASRALVLVPDTDDPQSFPAFAKMAGAVRSAGFGGPIGVVPLPPGSDPASLPRRRLRALVRMAAEVAREAAESPPGP